MAEIMEISSMTNTEVTQPQPRNACDIVDMFPEINRIEENAVHGKGHQQNNVESIDLRVNVVHDSPAQQIVNEGELAFDLFWEKRMKASKDGKNVMVISKPNVSFA